MAWVTPEYTSALTIWMQIAMQERYSRLLAKKYLYSLEIYSKISYGIKKDRQFRGFQAIQKLEKRVGKAKSQEIPKMLLIAGLNIQQSVYSAK